MSMCIYHGDLALADAVYLAGLIDPNARQTPPFMAGKDSADCAAVLVFDVVNKRR